MAASALTLRDIKEAVRQAASAHDINKAYLFGSCARGEATESSDIDLCLETGPSFSLFSAGDFSSCLERALEAPVDVVTERSLYPFVREGMLKDRVLVYERHSGIEEFLGG